VRTAVRREPQEPPIGPPTSHNDAHRALRGEHAARREKRDRKTEGRVGGVTRSPCDMEYARASPRNAPRMSVPSRAETAERDCATAAHSTERWRHVASEATLAGVAGAARTSRATANERR
jgi:hypothetical protein